MNLVSPPAASTARTSAGTASAPAPDFEDRRTYVLQRLDEAGTMFERSLELLSAPMPGGPVPHASPRARQLNGIIGAAMGAAIAVQEGLLWYGDLRAEATLPAALADPERAIIAHVMTAAQGLTRSEGFVRSMLELGQAPLDEFTWREQALADADDGARWVRELSTLVAAMQPRAAELRATPGAAA